MSKVAEVNKSSRKRSPTLIITILLALLLLAYGGGIILLPVSILSSYAKKNCQLTLTLDGVYARIYPVFVQDETLTVPIMECALYTLAGRMEEDGVWGDSLNAYQVYSNTYTNGLFVREAHEHSAIVLLALAKEQFGDKRFSESLTSLKTILGSFGDTSVLTDAVSLVPEIYTAWAIDLRDAGNFEVADSALSEFKIWAESYQKTEYVDAARMEMAQTNLDWGLELQSKKQFDEAKMKFDLAVLFDPEFVRQIQANEEKFYSEWSNYLVEQGEFSEAMEFYGIAAELAKKRDPVAAKDIMANAYIHWAEGLSKEEDFIGALVLLDYAESNLAADSTKETVKVARDDIYLAFSQSSGEQAQKAIKDAVAIICEHHISPSLPIFGLDKDQAQVGIYGVDAQLPESLVAITPGSLHYVACLEEESRIVGALKLPVSTTVFGGPPGVVQITYNNYQYVWNVVLRKTDSGNDVATTLIEGEKPPELTLSAVDFTVFSYFGPKPDIADLVEWILTVIK